jgi:RNA recognition motif-containing protein
MYKIFVGNLDYKVRPEQVRELFALYAPIEDLVLPTDPKTNKPRGFAIVMIRDPELGAAAVRGVQGRRLMGRELVVNEALKKKGKAAPAPEPERKGPFGPRMFQKGEGRSRGSRNPRRSGISGGHSGRPPNPSPTPPAGSGRSPAAPAAIPPVPPANPTSPARSPAAQSVPPGQPPADSSRAGIPKARPKSTPPTA